MTLKEAAAFAGCSLSTASRSIKHFQSTQKIFDLPRSGRPSTYSQGFEFELTGFYCQTNPLPGIGRWTVRWAALYLASHFELLNAAPSKSTIHRILKKNQLKPHLTRYFLQLTDPDFFPKMEHLVALYKNPPVNLFFFDECPGIQVLKRLVPDLRTDKTAKRLEEFEYIKNGVMNVLAFLDHSNGNIFAECHANHKTSTFVPLFKRHASQFQNEEHLHYVMDNLTTHMSYSFCQLVAELSDIPCPPEHTLNRQLKRVAWLTSKEKRIVIHFTPYHGSWLNLVENWFGIMNQKVLKESFNSVEHFKEGIDAFIGQWNTLLSHPFQWTYDGKGLHDKAVRRFIKVLEKPLVSLDIATLTKQLGLMKNILTDYPNEIKDETYQDFMNIFKAKYDAIKIYTLTEPGPIRKEKAKHALASLRTVIDALSHLRKSFAA